MAMPRLAVSLHSRLEAACHVPATWKPGACAPPLKSQQSCVPEEGSVLKGRAGTGQQFCDPGAGGQGDLWKSCGGMMGKMGVGSGTTGR